MPVNESLEVGTVIRINQILEDHVRHDLKLRENMQGIVCLHNVVFQLDHDAPMLDQQGTVKKEEEMFQFELPGSKIRIGPIGRMPDDHKVVVWMSQLGIWNITNVTWLFKDPPWVRWSSIKFGVFPRFTDEGIKI